MPKQFHGGDSFSHKTIEGEEAAQHRHMFIILDDQFRELDDETLQNMRNAGTIIAGIRNLSKALAVLIPLGAVFVGIGVFSAAQGWL